MEAIFCSLLIFLLLMFDFRKKNFILFPKHLPDIISETIMVIFISGIRIYSRIRSVRGHCLVRVGEAKSAFACKSPLTCKRRSRRFSIASIDSVGKVYILLLWSLGMQEKEITFLKILTNIFQ